MKLTRIAFAILALALGSTGWGQAGPFTKYGPVAGIQKSTGLTYTNTAAAAADVTGLFSCLADTSHFLNGAGTCTIPAGTGVTSVSQTVPAGFAVTGSPVTGSGTLAISYATGQTANRVLATPDGTTGALSLRALVAGDIPPINLGSTANGGVSSATILLGTNGGTSNGFFSVTGPTTALRTFTFPNASATVLTTNAAVTVPQGGTGLATLTANGVLLGEGTSNISPLVMGADTVLRGTASADPVAAAVPNCGSSTTALNYNTTTHAFGCQTITGGGTPGGSSGQMQYNNSGVLGGDAGLTTNAAGTITLTASTIPTQIFKASTGGADQKNTQCYYNFTALQYNCTFANDALGAESKFLSVTRGTGTAVTGVTIGNSTDLPAVTVPGGILAQGGRPAFSTSTSTVALGASAGGLAQISLVDSAGATDSKAWDTFVDTTAQHFRLINDANNSSTEWLTVTRSGMAVANITGPGGASMFPAAGTFTATYVGNGGVALTATYERMGYTACLLIPGSAVGASSATTFSMTGIPSIVQPSQAQTLTQFPPVAEDNGVIAGFTFSGSISGGTMTFLKNNSSSGWTNAGQKGITTSFSVCYLLN